MVFYDEFQPTGNSGSSSSIEYKTVTDFSQLHAVLHFLPFSLLLPAFSHTGYNQIFEFDFQRANKLTKQKNHLV